MPWPEEAEDEWFYEDLQDLLELTPPKDVLFIIGDWNAKVGSQEIPDERKWKVKSLSHVQLFSTPWTVAHQASLSMGFSSQKYWSGLSFSSPGYSRPRDWTHIFLVSCISGRFFITEPLGKTWACIDNDSYLYFMNKFLCDNLVQILYEHWECYEFYFILAFFFKLQTKLQHMACY